VQGGDHPTVHRRRRIEFDARCADAFHEQGSRRAARTLSRRGHDIDLGSDRTEQFKAGFERLAHLGFGPAFRLLARFGLGLRSRWRLGLRGLGRLDGRRY